MNPVHPKKLLLTKWTAVQPVARQKHFVVTKVIEPEATDETGGSAAASPMAHGEAAGKPGHKIDRRHGRPPTQARIEWIEIEAVFSGKVRRIPWRELRDTSLWRQGWV